MCGLRRSISSSAQRIVYLCIRVKNQIYDLNCNRFSPLDKNKIINDPVYGFISIPGTLIFDLIAHPYFQRLRFIRQLGLSDFVYPGAVHTRFHHALGAMHLMGRALESLRKKNIEISEDE